MRGGSRLLSIVYNLTLLLKMKEVFITTNVYVICHCHSKAKLKVL